MDPEIYLQSLGYTFPRISMRAGLEVELTSNQSDLAAICRILSEAGSKQEFQRVQCVWLKMALSLNSKQIADAIGWTSASVRRIQARFAKEGPACFMDGRSGGRKRENISIERERQILAKFERQTKRGNVLNVQQIRQAYELSAGRSVPLSTIYRLIERHGLRRFLPRASRSIIKSTSPRHPDHAHSDCN